MTSALSRLGCLDKRGVVAIFERLPLDIFLVRSIGEFEGAVFGVGPPGP